MGALCGKVNKPKVLIQINNEHLEDSNHQRRNSFEDFFKISSKSFPNQNKK